MNQVKPPTSVDLFFDDWRKAIGEKGEKWTKEYPKERGFHWIRNYEITGLTESISRDEPTIAYVEKVYDDLKFWLFQWPDIFARHEVLKAEWQGPIEPEE